MRRGGPSGGGKVFPLVLCFFGLFALLAVGILAQSTVAADQDENGTPEDFEDFNRSAGFIEPFQVGWICVMVVVMAAAALVATSYLIGRIL